MHSCIISESCKFPENQAWFLRLLMHGFQESCMISENPARFARIRHDFWGWSRGPQASFSPPSWAWGRHADRASAQRSPASSPSSVACPGLKTHQLPFELLSSRTCRQPVKKYANINPCSQPTKNRSPAHWWEWGLLWSPSPLSYFVSCSPTTARHGHLPIPLLPWSSSSPEGCCSC